MRKLMLFIVFIFTAVLVAISGNTLVNATEPGSAIVSSQIEPEETVPPGGGCKFDCDVVNPTTSSTVPPTLPPGVTAPPNCMYDCNVLNPTTPLTVPPTLPPGITAPPTCMYDCNILNPSTTSPTESDVTPQAVVQVAASTKATAPQTTTSMLPATGSESSIALAALLLFGAGTGLTLIARRNSVGN